MRRFIKRFFIFLLPILVVCISLEAFVRYIPNTYKYKYKWMQENAEDVETLVLGNSHSFYAIRADLLSGLSFNLTNPAQRLENDLFLLKYWGDKYKNLKTVICTISYFSWFSPGLEKIAPDYCRYYNLYMDCDLYNDLSIVNNFEISNPKHALLKVRAYILNQHASDGTCDEFGCANGNVLSKKDMVEWNKGDYNRKIIARHTIAGREYLEKNYSYMKEIAEFCKKRNIRLVLVTTPTWKNYYNNLDKKQLEEMYEITHKFQKEYDVSYFDYLKDSRFDADDFFNESHMSNIGAIKFTKILNEDINSCRH